MFGDKAIIATSEELTALTSNIKENFIRELSKPQIDLHDPEQVTEAIIGYFTDCELSGKRPGNMGLYRALGMSRQDMNNILTGKSKSKASPTCIDIFKKALHLLSEYREQLGLQGKINPIPLLFWQKNYDGLEDNSKVELVASRGSDPELTPEQVARQIEKDIPIDV